MVVDISTRRNTGHADLVRIMLDLKFGMNAFQSLAHWFYVFNWEAMSVSHTDNRPCQWDAHQFPCNSIMLNTWTSLLGKCCNGRLYVHTWWYWPCWSSEDHPRSDICGDSLSISTKLTVLFHLRSNVGIADAAQVIVRVREMLTSSHANTWCWLLERSGLEKDAMVVYISTRCNTGHADLVRITLDLRFGMNAFQSLAHCVYVVTWEAMSVSQRQHRSSPVLVRC